MEIKISFPESKMFVANVFGKYPKSGGVYALYSKEGVLLYVGLSINLKKRLADHFRGKFAKFIDRVELFIVEDGAEREILETYLIDLWKPLFNESKVYSYKSFAPLATDKRLELAQDVYHLVELCRKDYSYVFENDPLLQNRVRHIPVNDNPKPLRKINEPRNTYYPLHKKYPYDCRQIVALVSDYPNVKLEDIKTRFMRCFTHKTDDQIMEMLERDLGLSVTR